MLDQKLLDILPDALIIVDKQARVLWCNRAAVALLRLKQGWHARQDIAALVCIAGIKNFCLTAAHAEAAEFQFDANEDTWLAISMLDYQRGKRVLCLRDITHLHHLEQMRRDFVANVSHELRTPLTVVQGYLESLLEYDTALNDTHKKILQKIAQQSQRMSKIIEDLLLLARLETSVDGLEETQQVAVPQMLQSIYEDARALSDNRHHFHLQIDDSLYLAGQPKALQGAFSNLVFNAVNYTPANTHIYLDWYVDADGAHFVVRDTGQGIGAQHIPRLTERFYRIDTDRSRESGGTGLGLAIVKHVLIRHGAALDISSCLGQGCVFACHFPLVASLRR